MQKSDYSLRIKARTSRDNIMIGGSYGSKQNFAAKIERPRQPYFGKNSPSPRGIHWAAMPVQTGRPWDQGLNFYSNS